MNGQTQQELTPEQQERIQRLGALAQEQENAILNQQRIEWAESRNVLLRANILNLAEEIGRLETDRVTLIRQLEALGEVPQVDMDADSEDSEKPSESDDTP